MDCGGGGCSVANGDGSCSGVSGPLQVVRTVRVAPVKTAEQSGHVIIVHFVHREREPARVAVTVRDESERDLDLFSIGGVFVGCAIPETVKVSHQILGADDVGLIVKLNRTKVNKTVMSKITCVQ